MSYLTALGSWLSAYNDAFIVAWASPAPNAVSGWQIVENLYGLLGVIDYDTTWPRIMIYGAGLVFASPGMIIIPYWLVLLVVASFTALLWHRDRRRRSAYGFGAAYSSLAVGSSVAWRRCVGAFGRARPVIAGSAATT